MPCASIANPRRLTIQSAAASVLHTKQEPHTQLLLADSSLPTPYETDITAWALPRTRPVSRERGIRRKRREFLRSDSCPDETTIEKHIQQVNGGLLEIPKNESDASLWLDRLNTAQRQQSHTGVLAVWDLVAQNELLCYMRSQEAMSFWVTILDAVLHDEAQLQRVALYAEWAFETHGVSWPSLYTRTLSYCLENRQHHRAMQWHIRLMPNFDPGHEEFGDLLSQFMSCTDVELQQTLRSLYATSRHHNLYDRIISQLYEAGLSRLCSEWRSLFLRFHDLPQPTPDSQPYLRFLVQYYPGKALKLEEQMVVDLNSPAYWKAEREALWDAMDGRHREKTPTGRHYSDPLGARWFASSWVPLDFAIHAIHALGVRQIGPLSLQSIALRDPKPPAILARIEQLHRANIGIGHSAYARAVSYFAQRGEEELLQELLHTDIHPDVFDDPVVQQDIRNKALEAGDWKTHMLLMAVQPAVTHQSIESTSNLLLQQRLAHRQMHQALGLMDDMRSMNIEISEASVQQIYSRILDPLPWNPIVEPTNLQNLQLAITYLSRLLQLQKPVPSRYWQKVFFGLGKFGLLHELEGLCSGVLDSFQLHCSSQGGLVPVHRTDAPPSAVGVAASHLFVPADLPISHEFHPMHKIFNNSALHIAVIRWGFKAYMSRQSLTAYPDSESAAASMARGVLLLAKLGERGIPYETALVRKEVTRWLTRIYHPSRKTSFTSHGLPDLVVVREQINRAWRASGDQLLPGIITLRDAIARTKCRQSVVNCAP